MFCFLSLSLLLVCLYIFSPLSPAPFFSQGQKGKENLLQIKAFRLSVPSESLLKLLSANSALKQRHLHRKTWDRFSAGASSVTALHHFTTSKKEEGLGENPGKEKPEKDKEIYASVTKKNANKKIKPKLDILKDLPSEANSIVCKHYNKNQWNESHLKAWATNVGRSTAQELDVSVDSVTVIITEFQEKKYSCFLSILTQSDFQYRITTAEPEQLRVKEHRQGLLPFLLPKRCCFSNKWCIFLKL